MSRRAFVTVVFSAWVSLGAAAAVLHARETSFPLPPVTARLMYLTSGAAANRLALSFDALLADVYWIRAIQHYGRDYKNRSRANRFELLQPLLDVTTTLDPHFLIAYRFGAVFLAVHPPEGPGRADLAIALLQKGLKANPERWQLAHDIAFTHYLYTGDYRAAAEWFERAAAMPRAPSWLGPLAATTLAQGGNRQGARQMLQELRGSQEQYLRRAAERILMQLDALDRVDVLQRLVDAYRDRQGRYPASWAEMAAARALPGVPVDPSDVPFALDPNTGRVSLAPASRLLPLPPTLQNQ